MYLKSLVKLVCFVVTLNVVFLLLINMPVNGSPMVDTYNNNTFALPYDYIPDATPTRYIVKPTGLIVWEVTPTPTRIIKPITTPTKPVITSPIPWPTWPTFTPVPTKLIKPTPTPTNIVILTPKPTKTIMPITTPTPTKTIIPTKTPTSTKTIIPTKTPTPTKTIIPTATSTQVVTPTATSTATPVVSSTKPTATVVNVSPGRTEEPTIKPIATPKITDMPEESPKPGSIVIVQRFYVGKQIYYVNNDKKEMDTAPVIKDGRTLLPVRYVS